MMPLIVAMSAALPACRKVSQTAEIKPLDRAYGIEPDWNDPQHLIPLSFQQAQGQRLFYQDCVWCHADSTPAGPSNRSNVNPAPALMNDGSVLNRLSDEYLRNIISLGGSAMGKSAMMPPWELSLTQDDIRALIAFTRAISQPPYLPAARPESQYLVK
jgi:cytochrome c5